MDICRCTTHPCPHEEQAEKRKPPDEKEKK